MNYEIIGLNSPKSKYVPHLVQLKAIETKSLDFKVPSEISIEDIERSQGLVEALLAQNSDFLLAMIDEKTSLGYCVGKQDNSQGEIYRSMGLFVREQYRGEGVGRGLLERQIQNCRNSEYGHITTTTTLQNGTSQSLLEKLGFELEAEMNGIFEYTLRL